MKAKRTRKQPKAKPIRGTDGSRGSSTATATTLRRVKRADAPTIVFEERGTGGVEEHWTRGVEERGTKLNNECEQGVKTPGGAGK